MKPGNLRKQGANSGGGNRQMRKLYPLASSVTKRFFVVCYQKGSKRYESAEKNFYIRIRYRRTSR